MPVQNWPTELLWPTLSLLEAAPVDIKIIGAVPFTRYLRKERGVEVFSISLREIDEELEGRKAKKEIVIPLEY